MAISITSISSTDAPMSLPSANIAHASVFRDELATRAAGFESGIIALTAEMEGQQQAFDLKIAEITEAHNRAKADLMTRLADMQRGKAMAVIALDLYDAPQVQD